MGAGSARLAVEPIVLDSEVARVDDDDSAQEALEVVIVRDDAGKRAVLGFGVRWRVGRHVGRADKTGVEGRREAGEGLQNERPVTRTSPQSLR